MKGWPRKIKRILVGNTLSNPVLKFFDQWYQEEKRQNLKKEKVLGDWLAASCK